MRRPIGAFSAGVWLALSLTIAGPRPCRASSNPAPAGTQVRLARLNLPMTFEANHGQTDARVRFLARGGGYSLFLTAQEAVLGLRGEAGRGAAIRMKLTGANPTPRLEGEDLLPGRANYFLGKEEKAWRSGAPLYGRVRYREVYPGIDMVFYGNQGQLEYDLVLEPGADPSRLQLAFEGVGRLRIDERGDLILSVAGGEVVQRRPLIYQVSNGERRPLHGGYVLRAKNRVGFQVAAYDPALGLVIDPTLTYSTFLGGSGGDYGAAVAVAGDGSVFVTGFTGSIDFPVKPNPGALDTSLSGPSDVFVCKINPFASGSASLVYATYLGGSARDETRGIAVDAYGSAYVTGYTYSSDFPTTLGAFDRTFVGGPQYYEYDGFVTKLNATGSQLVYSTLLGGSSGDWLSAIAVDAAGNAYVAGGSCGNFPTTPGALRTSCSGTGDAVVSKLNPAGTALVYSTFLGGSGGQRASSVAVDAAGNAHVGGWTTSSNFPMSGAFDASPPGSYTKGFVAKLNATGSALMYSTYVGGITHQTAIFGLALDPAGYVYVTGFTQSTDFPTTPGAYMPLDDGIIDWEVFLTKLNPAATGAASLVYSTYLGSNAWNEYGMAVAADQFGAAYVVGWTQGNAPPSASLDFPITAGALKPCTPYGREPFVSVFNPAASGSASLIYSTCLGGTTSDEASGAALDASFGLSIVGDTYSTDFPTTPTAFQGTLTGGTTGHDAFISRIDLSDLVHCSYILSPSSVTVVPGGGSGTIAVTAPPGCGWTADSNDGWITITGGASGAGNGTISHLVAPGSPRTGSITAAAQTVFVTQAKLTPTITWNNPADIAYGTALSSTQLNATASVPGTFTYTPPAGTVLNAGGGQTLSVLFTPTDSANYNSATASVLINVLKASASITLSNLNHTYDGAPKVATATTNPSGLATVSITYNGSATPPVNANSYAVVASLDNANYTAPAANGTLIIAKATPVITWGNPADIVYGTALSSTQLNATASVSGSFTYTPAAGTALNAGAGQNLSVLFTPADTANYNQASKTVQISVLKASTSTALASSVNPSLAGQVVTFTAAVTSGAGAPTGSVQFTVDGGPLGPPVPLTGGAASAGADSLAPGVHAVTAAYGGDANFTASSGALSQTVSVAATTATIEVVAALHTVGTGTNPASVKSPLALSLKVFDKTAVGSPDPKDFGTIWETRTPVPALITDLGTASVGGGQAQLYRIVAPAGGSYLAIGKTTALTPAIYVGSPTDPLPAGSTTQKHLQVIQNGAGKKVPAKTTAVPGSLLLIAEPEYLEYTSDIELLPVIYESVEGPWSSTVQAEPPEGFVATPGALQAQVTDGAIEAVQFTVRDLGSKWTSTKVTHKLRHKGKDLTIVSTPAMLDGRNNKK